MVMYRHLKGRAIHCQIIINSYSGHLQQLLTGFSELHQQGLINLDIKKGPKHHRASHLSRVILKVIVNKNIRFFKELVDKKR